MSAEARPGTLDAAAAPGARPPRSLRLASTPEPGESLIGLLAGATRKNVLVSLAVPLRRLGLELLHPGTVSLLPPDALASLAAVLGCAAEDVLDRATPYLGENARGGPVRWGVNGALLREDLILERRRISPLTLRDRPVHQAWWLVGLLPFCPVSLELLRDDCSACSKVLRWRTAWGIGVCEHCEEPVGPSDAPPLAAGLAEGYRAFADLLSVEPVRRAGALDRLPEPVRRLDPVVLLEAVFKVGTICRDSPARVARKAFVRMEPQEIAAIACRGMDLLLDWPNGIRDWARARGQSLLHDRRACSALRSDLRWLGLPHSSRPAQGELVRQALPDLFGGFYRSFAEPGHVVLGNEACRLTGIDFADLVKLRDAGLITARRFSQGRRTRVQYDAREIAALARLLREAVPSTRLEWSLGVPLYGVEQLACEGLVVRADEPAVLLLHDELRLRKESVSDLRARIEKGARAEEPPKGSIPLGTAICRIGGREKPWGAVIRALVDGALPYWMGPPTRTRKPFRRRLLVRPEDMRAFDSVRFDPDAHPGLPFSDGITMCDAAELLNVGPVEMGPLRAGGILEFVAHGVSLRARKSEVLRLGQELVAVAELAQRAGLASGRVSRLLASAPIERVAFGWRRRDVVALNHPALSPFVARP